MWVRPGADVYSGPLFKSFQEKPLLTKSLLVLSLNSSFQLSKSGFDPPKLASCLEARSYGELVSL